MGKEITKVGRHLLAAHVNLDGLEDKWTTESSDEPPCASCGEIIKSPKTPLRFWRKAATEEIALCPKCFEDRCQ